MVKFTFAIRSQKEFRLGSEKELTERTKVPFRPDAVASVRANSDVV